MTHMVCVEGIATRCSLVRPKIVKSVHYCPATNKMLSRQYRDSTSLDGGLPTGAVYPTKDDEGHPLETEYGLSQYKDHQTLSVQEMPEHAPIGQLPCSIDVVLDHDLVDKCKPGDRIQIIGIFRGLSGARAGGATSGLFKSALIANHVRILSQDVRGASCTADDVTNIRRVASRDDIFALLSRSIAPSICGSMEIKKAILLQQMGGVERILANGGHIRGDINILMVGDPSTAKSQLLRHCLHLSPLAINTTGRGSSGVGLTAAVTSDPETGERRLEAGAMVLADRGVVCIDEFDKMSEGDRVAIHEVMEQQTVTIAKAGIHCSLNARCSVIAAANPIYGQYDKSLTPQRNVGLPDSLLSRFDLLFIVLDNLEAGHDKKISSHVLRIHQYERPGAEGVPDALGVTRASGAGFGNSMFASSSGDADGPDGDDAEADKTSEVFVRFNPLLHSGAFDASAEDEERGSAFARVQRDSMRELLSTDFVQKYIAYAKRQFAPQLTKAASELLSEAYAELRSKQDTRTSCVTPRVLESLIRLASAHAKTRLSRTVDEEDCAAAVDIMRFALYHDADPLGMHDVGAAGKRVRELGGDAASGGGGGGGNDEGGDGSGAKRQRRAAASSSSSAAAAAGGEMEDEDEMDTDRSSFLDGTQELELDDSQLSQSQSQSQSASADETKEAQIDAPPITVDEDSEAFRNFKSTLAQMCVVLLCVPCSFVIVSSSTLPLTSRHPPNPAPI